ncbi:MAG: orotidine-5-phosphate decarboxylase [Candidatus Parcubacteria bacterium]|jgi:orotidine-5'-phosphate decarboxylase
METCDFRRLLEERWDEGKFLCVGLDSDYRKIPQAIRDRHSDVGAAIEVFSCAIIDATANLVCAYKPNLAFFLAHGEAGFRALKATISYSHAAAPNVPVILDAKDADIGNTNEGYYDMAFKELRADAVTVNPYLGREALSPFLDRHPLKGIIVLCRTSNLGAGEFQDLEVAPGEMLYQRVARNVAEQWNNNGNCAVVVGATYPDELAKVRQIVGDLPILIPGIGTQLGDVRRAVNAGRDHRGKGMIINASRAVLFASSGEDFAEAARNEASEIDSDIRAALKAGAA